jgi:hypothetical protein
MGGALSGDEPLIVFFKFICCFLIFNIEFYSEVLQKVCLFICYWGNPLENALGDVDNPLANLLQWVRGN